MRSPFPGLDPYLQKFWRDVHTSLIIYTRELLAGKLPRSLHMFVEERIVFESQDGRSGAYPYRQYVPDVTLIESRFGSSDELREEHVAVAEPISIRFAQEPITEAYIEIRDAATGGKVITTIEFLSPSNKVPGPAKDAFLKKQADMRAGNVSLVEIDLVRGGDWVLALPEYAVKPEDRSELRISIIRGWVRDLSSYYPIKLPQRLPTIPIPLRREDDPLQLDLQGLFDLCYERGRYADMIDYTQAPFPLLTAQDQGWAQELLLRARQAG